MGRELVTLGPAGTAGPASADAAFSTPLRDRAHEPRSLVGTIGSLRGAPKRPTMGWRAASPGSTRRGKGVMSGRSALRAVMGVLAVGGLAACSFGPNRITFYNRTTQDVAVVYSPVSGAWVVVPACGSVVSEWEPAPSPLPPPGLPVVYRANVPFGPEGGVQAMVVVSAAAPAASPRTRARDRPPRPRRRPGIPRRSSRRQPCRRLNPILSRRLRQSRVRPT